MVLEVRGLEIAEGPAAAAPGASAGGTGRPPGAGENGPAATGGRGAGRGAAARRTSAEELEDAEEFQDAEEAPAKDGSGFSHNGPNGTPALANAGSALSLDSLASRASELSRASEASLSSAEWTSELRPFSCRCAVEWCAHAAAAAPSAFRPCLRLAGDAPPPLTVPPTACPTGA